MFKRSWVHIPAPVFTVFRCWKRQKINKKEAGDGPFLTTQRLFIPNIRDCIKCHIKSFKRLLSKTDLEKVLASASIIIVFWAGIDRIVNHPDWPNCVMTKMYVHLNSKITRTPILWDDHISIRSIWIFDIDNCNSVNSLDGQHAVH